MKFKSLRDKAIDENVLSLEESLRLDAALEASDQLEAVHFVKSLNDDEPSLAWRSELNSKLSNLSTAKRTRKQWGRVAWATACGCALLVAINVSMPVNQSEQDLSASRLQSSTSIEDTILAEHQDAVSQSSLGVYISYGEMNAPDATQDEPSL